MRDSAAMPPAVTISVCIPTYRRPLLLEEALRSCASQTRLPDEVVIGDDSPDDTTERAVERLRGKLPFPIAYVRHEPRLGQNANVNDVFLRATGSHLVLLHDDDLLTPVALAALIACWDAIPSLSGAFGKQIVIAEDGRELLERSVEMNAAYGRGPGRAGLQRDAWDVGLSQQLPNNGYMLRTSVAQETLWKPESEVGYGGEFEFGFRLGLAGHAFYFTDVYTSKYRLSSSGSISASSRDDAALRSYLLARDAALPPEAEASRHAKLRRSAPVAMGQALRLRRRGLAWQIYRSPEHSWKQRLSPGGIRRLISLLSPKTW